MLYKYPYTNLYNLNLDWLIQAVKELQEIVEPLENVVTSVNGMTGNVELTREILTQILGGMVSKFNGRDGDVELTAEDVNGTLIDITWTSDPGDAIGDLTQTQLDEMYASGKRVLIFVNNLGVADQVYFLQYYDSHAQPQEYSPTTALAGVATFNGMTGNVTATGADLATSETDQTTIAANLANLENTKVPNTRTVNNQPLSANVSINAANVPSQAIAGATDVEMALGNLNASKVPNARQVNGKSLINDITLNDEDIPSQVVSGQTTVEGALTDIDSRVSNQSRQIGEKADKPVIVTVTVDTSGASMSSTDLAKLTPDMIMCWYTGDRTKLTSKLEINPGSGQQPTGTATSQTTFAVAFIHSAKRGGIASVICGTGDITYKNVNSVTLPNGINVGAEIVSVTLPPGTYILKFSVTFTSDGTFLAKISTNNPWLEVVQFKNVNTGWFSLESIGFATFTQPTTVTLKGYQQSNDETKTANGFINTLKIL